MQPEPYRETIRERLERDLSAIRAQLADPAIAGLVLDRLPNGELAWLRAEPPADEDRRYVLTDAGRRDLDEDRRARALEALFGQPWPTVAETCRLNVVA